MPCFLLKTMGGSLKVLIPRTFAISNGETWEWTISERWHSLCSSPPFPFLSHSFFARSELLYPIEASSVGFRYICISVYISDGSQFTQQRRNDWKDIENTVLCRWQNEDTAVLMTIWVAKSNYWTGFNMTREWVTGLVTAQNKSSGKNHWLGGKSTKRACRLFATLRATKVAKITVILRGNTVSGSTVSSLSTSPSSAHILTRMEILLRWQNVINVPVSCFCAQFFATV